MKRVKTAKANVTYVTGPQGRPVGSKTRRITGSLKKILGKLEVYVSYENITSRRLRSFEMHFSEWVLYTIEHGSSTNPDQVAMMLYRCPNGEVTEKVTMIVEWIK